MKILAGRIVAVADVFDAITRATARIAIACLSMKPSGSWSKGEAPISTLDLFLDRIEEVRKLADKYSDSERDAADTRRPASKPFGRGSLGESTRRKRQAAAIAYFEAMNSGGAPPAERVALKRLVA